MNTMKFQDLVKGCHGRKIAYTDVEQITEDNIVKIYQNPHSPQFTFIEKAVSEMSQAEKQQLRLLAILDQSKVSWGDLANTIN